MEGMQLVVDVDVKTRGKGRECVPAWTRRLSTLVSQTRYLPQKEGMLTYAYLLHTAAQQMETNILPNLRI